jgi:hypothetical protein
MDVAVTADLFPESLPGADLLPERPVAAASVPTHLGIDSLATPIGEARIVTDEAGRLRAFDWDDHDPRLRRLLGQHYGTLAVETVPSAVGGASLVLGQAIRRGGDLLVEATVTCACLRNGRAARMPPMVRNALRS